LDRSASAGCSVNTQEVAVADFIDSMIEGWAQSRTASVRESVDAPLEGLEGFSLSPDTSGTAQDAPTPLDAAQAVREAVVAKGGRRPKVDYWKPVAAKALGISRLFAKRWEAVLDAGIEAGLFRIDSDTLSHPILVVLDPEPVISEPVEVNKPVISASMPEGWVAPVTLPCGHTNWPHDGLTADAPKQVAAREAGFCCERVRSATAARKRLNPSAKGPAPVTVRWEIKGLHEPVPMSLRRSPEREGGPGWSGLCCDPETGLYIGGLGNHCRHHHDGPERCVVHAR
jgi:hypothetical protein